MNRIVIDCNKKEGVISPELHSHFIEFLGSCIYDGIWVGEESEIENYGGIRKDAADALAALEPPIIRWPGGCYADTYHWRNGIGERSKRPVTYNENFGTFERDNNHFGIHEFMELCRITGAKPWLNINLLSGSVGEMRDWVEYCNRREETELSLLRKRNGSPEPFMVEYWGIGNECWAGGGNMTAEMYAEEFRKYSSAMPLCDSRNPDSSFSMKRIASGADGNKPKERVEWTRRFFKALGQFRQPQLDAMDLHFYNWNVENPEDTDISFSEEGWYKVIESCFELEDVIKEQYALIQEGLSGFPEAEGFFPAAEPKCDLVVGEWGNWHGSSFKSRPALYQQCTMRDAVTTALTLDIFHRNCNLVKAACVAQSVNVLNSLILTEGNQTILTPNYDIFMMYKVHRGAEKLSLHIENAAFENAGTAENIYVFASEKGNHVFVNLINADMTKEQEIFLEFADGKKLCPESVQTIWAEKASDYNSAQEPDKIRCRQGVMPAGREGGFLYSAKPASVNVLSFIVM